MVPRRIICAAVVASVLAPLTLSAQRSVDIRRATTGTVAVRVGGTFASVKIVAWAHDSLVLTGTLPKGTRIEGGAAAPSTPITGIKFWVEPAPTDVGGGELELRVPANARVWVKTANATISSEGVTGSLDLNIVAGRIVVRGNAREATLESMDGSVTVDGAATWMRIKTADGDVLVRGSCEDFGATTVSGRVELRDGSFERARLESVTGNLVFAGDFARAASVSMDTHSGAIELLLPSRPHANIDVRTLTGRIDNTLSPKRPTPGRDGRGEELTLELGAGGAQAMLRSFKGSIRLAAR